MGFFIDGICKAKWENAKKICTQSGGSLPTKKDLEQVIVDCDGLLADGANRGVNSSIYKNNVNTSYQSCYKNKGFRDSTYYWSSDSSIKVKDFAWIIDFKDGVVSKNFKVYDYYVRCIGDVQ